MNLRVWLAISVASIGFGTSGVATRAALATGLGPLTIVAVRATAAALLIYAYMLVARRSVSRDRRTLRTGAVFSVLQLAVPFALTTLAYQNASAGFVGLLVATLPLATAVLAHFFLPDEPLTTAKAAGLAVALVGVGFMLASGDSGLATGGRPLLAATLTSAAIVSIAVSGIYAKQQAGAYDPVEITGMQNVGGAVLLGAAMMVFEGLPSGFTAWGSVLLGYLTVMGSVIPFLLFYWLLRHVSATKASLMAYIVPLVALVSGIALLDERLQLGIAVGGLLILVGVVWTDRTERTKIPAIPEM